MAFFIDRTSDSHTVILRIGEGLDFRNATEFKKVCQEQVQSAVRHFILDFSEARLLDSVGLGAIFSLYRNVTPTNGQVVFAAVSAPVQVMVQVTKIYRVFPQYKTVALACEALRVAQ